MGERFIKYFLLISLVGLGLCFEAYAQGKGDPAKPRQKDRLVVLGTTDSSTGCVASNDPNRPRPKTVSGGILNDKAISLTKPVYPTTGLAKRVSGTVYVQVLVGEDGSVLTALAVMGDQRLRSAAEVAALQARFKPTFLGDALSQAPVKVSGVILYRFK